MLFIFICAWKSGCCGGVTSAAAAFCRYLEEVLRYFKDSQDLLTSNIIRYIVLNAKQHTVRETGERYERSLFVKTDRERVRTYRKKKKGCDMVFNTGAALLDAIVLAVVSREKEGTYGYKITQDVRKVIDISDSTLYPVLRRLQKDQCLMVYDLECAGRNRRYYKVTEQGLAQLGLYKEEWKRYSSNISMVFEGGINNES